MVKGVHRDSGIAYRFGQPRPLVDRYFVDTRGTVCPVFMLESVWNFGGYILDQRSAERDVEQLGSPADCQQGKPQIARGLDESDLGSVASDVGFAAVRRPGLSIQKRLYIFAAGEQQSVHPGKNCVDCIVTRKRRNDEWYQSCTFKCGNVGTVESHTMKFLIACIRGCRNGDDRGGPGGSS